MIAMSTTSLFLNFATLLPHFSVGINVSNNLRDGYVEARLNDAPNTLSKINISSIQEGMRGKIMHDEDVVDDNTYEVSQKKKKAMNQSVNNIIDAFIQAPAILKAGLDVSAINALIPSFVDNLFPALAEDLTSNAFDLWGNVNSSIGYASFFMRNFTMFPVSANRMTISTYQEPTSKNNITLVVDTGKIVVGFKEVGGALALFGVDGDCSVSAKLKMEIHSIHLSIDFLSHENTGKFDYIPSSLKLEGLDFNIEPVLSNNICSVVFSIANYLFTPLAKQLAASFLNDIGYKLEQFLSAEIQPGNFTIDPVSLTILGGELSIKPEMKGINAGKESGLMALGGEYSLILEAQLNEPSWRAGYKRVETVHSEHDFPLPSMDNLINANIGADGVNMIFRIMWYLVWSQVVDDERAMRDILCVPTDFDPCPFPPIIKEFGVSNIFYYPFVVLLGLHSKYAVHFVAEPPQVRFEDGEYITGFSPATVMIYGSSNRLKKDNDTGATLLATMTTDIVADVSTLDYDKTTSGFSGLQIVDFSFSNSTLSYTGTPLFDFLAPIYKFLTSGLVVGLLERIVSETVDAFLIPYLNVEIENVLMNLPGIPPIEGFPRTGYNLQTRLIGVDMASFPGSDDLQSYATMGANVEFDVVPSSSSRGDRTLLIDDDGRKTDIENPEPYDMREKLEQNVFRWAQEYSMKTDKEHNHDEIQLSWWYENSDTDTKEVHKYRIDEKTSKPIELKTP